MKATEIYEKVTASLLKQLEDPSNLATWRAPWHGSNFLPRNASTSNAYQGGNVIVLWSEQLDKAYPTALWATYKQWEALGAQVRKGEKGTGLVKYQSVIDRRTKDLPEDQQRNALIPLGFTVFNAAQVDGFTPPPADTIDISDKLEDVEEFFSNIPSRIIEGSPAYVPSLDVIQLPPVSDFYDHTGFYATSAHEHAHWTGHDSRLKRDHTGRFGSEAYAFEELVAEISAAFTAAALGFETAPRPDHASYIAHWAKILRDDSTAIYKAASEAQKATNFLFTFQPEEQQS
jgi:antirestriction protein ArdC